MLLRAYTNDCGKFGVSCQRHVFLQIHLAAMLQLPAGTTEVSEAHDFPAEIWSVLYRAHGTKRILQIGINLQLLGELRGADLDERRHDRLHVRA